MGDTEVEVQGKIEQIFSTMEYKDDPESFNKLENWLNNRNRIVLVDGISGDKPAPMAIKNVISGEPLCQFVYRASIDTKHIKYRAHDRQRLLDRLAEKVHANEDLFAEIELATRGIAKKHTRQAVRLLVDYFHFYAACSKGSNTEPINSSGIVMDRVPLFVLGWFLGPLLALGHNVCLASDSKISVAICLLSESAVAAGFPEGTIKNFHSYQFFNITNHRLSKSTVIGDLNKTGFPIDYNIFNNTLYLSSSSFGVPMIIFDSADLESAYNCIKETVARDNALNPLFAKDIFIQETVYDVFVERLKIRMNLTRHANMEERVGEGIIIYHNKEKRNSPLIIFGLNVSHNDAIKRLGVDFTSVTAFRGISEAMALANNTEQGLACSVWTENLSLSNEIARKLQVTNIWINSHGLFAAEFALSPYKKYANGYFGGHEGFYESDFFAKGILETAYLSNQLIVPVQEIINEAKKAQGTWLKLSILQRTVKIRSILNQICANKANWGDLTEWLEDWVTLVNDFSCTFDASVRNYNNHNVLTIREPIGILAVVADYDVNKHLIIAALIQGNAVIIINSVDRFQRFYDLLAADMKGMVTVLPPLLKTITTILQHNEVNYCYTKHVAFFEAIGENLIKTQGFKLKEALPDWRDVLIKTTLVKHVWFDAGHSFV